MNWKSAIKDAIRTGAFFIPCFSQELNDREESVMHSELRDAIDVLRNMPPARIWLIPVLLNETTISQHLISTHELLSDINAVKLYEDWDAGVQKILEAMNLDDLNYREALHLVDLVSYHPSERIHALQRLQNKKFSSRRDILTIISPAVVRTLRDTDEVCHSAIEALVAFGSAAIPALNEAMREGDTILRGRAAVVIGRTTPASDDVILALVDALRDHYDHVRALAVIALVQTEITSIDKLLQNLDSKVRKQAIASLQEVGLKTRARAEQRSCFDGYRGLEN
jgi:hypothetical protein